MEKFYFVLFRIDKSDGSAPSSSENDPESRKKVQLSSQFRLIPGLFQQYKAESKPEQRFYCYCGLYIVGWLRTSDWQTRLLSSTVSRRRQCALMEEIMFYNLYCLPLSLCCRQNISSLCSLFRVEPFDVRYSVFAPGLLSSQFYK